MIPNVTEQYANIPGLTIEETEDARASHLVTYDGEPPVPVCPYDDRRLRTLPYLKPRVVTDISDNALVKVLYRQRRYKCPDCGRELQPESPYIRRGASTTKQADDYIAHQALYHSYEYVARQSDGVVTKSQVKRIFEACAQEQIQDYLANLVAPEHLGIHIVGPDKNPYVLLSDLDIGSCYDLLPLSEFTSFVAVALLMRLLEQKDETNNPITKAICTEMDSEILVPLKGMQGSIPGIDVCVARTSIYRAYAKAVYDAVAKKYEKQKKKPFLNLIATPWFKDLTPIEEDKMRHLAAQDPMHGIDWWIENLFVIKKMVLKDKWDKQDYQRWLTNLSLIKEFKDFVKYLIVSDPEIQCGFKCQDLLKRHEEETKEVNEIIELNQRCSFDVLRARMLLTIHPILIRTQKQDRGIMYAGIDMKRLYTKMYQILVLREPY